VREYAALSAVAGSLAVLALLSGRVGRVEGALLLAAYAGLVALVWWRERQPPMLGELAELAEETEGPGPRTGRSPAVALALALLGVGLMLAGGDLAVRGAVRVVESLGRTDSAVGLTVLALATTAELFALVLTAMRHDVPEVAVAGVVGSAAYNATATLGAAALAAPLAVEGVLPAALVAAGLPVAVLVLAPTGRLGRPAGALLLAGYATYVGIVLA
jgi:cation:H+ antiporter